MIGYKIRRTLSFVRLPHLCIIFKLNSKKSLCVTYKLIIEAFYAKLKDLCQAKQKTQFPNNFKNYSDGHSIFPTTKLGFWLCSC